QLLDGGARPQSHLPAEQVDRLVLALVVLEREGVPRLHVQDLADVAVRVGPDELVAPGFLDSRDGHLISEPKGACRQSSGARRCRVADTSPSPRILQRRYPTRPSPPRSRRSTLPRARRPRRDPSRAGDTRGSGGG